MMSRKTVRESLLGFYFLFFLLNSAKANITSLCDTADSYWEVQEGKQDNTFTCGGLRANDTVQWFLRDSLFGEIYLGSCPPFRVNENQSVCSTRYFPIFKPSRSSDDESFMVVNTTASPITTLFEEGRLLCSVQGLPGANSSCRLDYIYSDENVSCTVEFRNNTWTVYGECDVKRTRSTQNRYRCEWIQTKKSSGESILIANTSMIIKALSGTHCSGSCNFTSYLPPVGQYSYHVIIVPGQVTVNASFIGSDKICQPSNTASHNCPQYVPDGDDLNCTCVVSDVGSPPGVLQWSTTLSPELHLSAAHVLDDQIHVCQLLWNETVLQSVEYVFNITSPPSIPVIFPLSDIKGRPTYPFLAGTSGTLGCQSNQTGRPEANFTWPVLATGHASGSNLTFYNLSREDNGRIVTCKASNVYTKDKKPVDDATFFLQVYYKPEISFSFIHASDANGCVALTNKSDSRMCVVPEGQRVQINCTADSNPGPDLFEWLSQNNDIYSNTSELVIESANHTIHSGDYNCTVTTKQENMDIRLPLTSSALFTVIVGYSPRALAFVINNLSSLTVNVNEKSQVRMRCYCRGRPQPSVQLINAAHPSHFLNQSQPTDDISDDVETGEVSLSIDEVPCEASGVYRCEVNNSLGQDSQSHMLLVSCAPRGKLTDKKFPTISITNGAGVLTFEMTAYPTPEVKNMAFLGMNETSDGHPVKENRIYVACSSTLLAPAAVTCNIIIINKTDIDEGVYSIVFSNILGDLTFSFFVTETNDSSNAEVSTNTEDKKLIIVVPAVVLAAVVVLIFVVVIWSWQHGWILPCADRTNQRNIQQNQTSGVTSQYLTPVSAKAFRKKKGRERPVYDALRPEDIRMRAEYEDLRLQQNGNEISPYETVENLTGSQQTNVI